MMVHNTATLLVADDSGVERLTCEDRQHYQDDPQNVDRMSNSLTTLYCLMICPFRMTMGT